MEVIISMKKSLLILSLLPLLVLGGCVASSATALAADNDRFYTIPPYTPPTPPEQPKNIASIDILGIPEDYRIAMGLFDEANIRCQITYTDNSTSTFQLLEETLPYEIREMLGQEGEHNITVQIRNQKVTFKIIMVDEGIRYVVRFLNYNDDVLYQTKVMPNNKVQYLGDDPRRMSDVVYKYKYSGWDHDIDTYLVDKSTDIYATYSPVFKNNDYLPIEQTSQFVSEYKGTMPGGTNDSHYVCYYVGRISNVPIARDTALEYREHTQGNKEAIDYSFDDDDSPLDPEYSSPQYDYHPNINDTLHGAINLAYKYDETEAAKYDDKYIPSGPQYININSNLINEYPFTLSSIRSRNIEGKTYNTSIAKYEDVISNFLSDAKVGRLQIPEDFPDGKYTATIYIDIDVYVWMYAEQTPVGIGKSPIWAIACASNIYVGLNDYENRYTGLYSFKTSTYEEDMMGIDMFVPMMENARSAYEG